MTFPPTSSQVDPRALGIAPAPGAAPPPPRPSRPAVHRNPADVDAVTVIESAVRRPLDSDTQTDVDAPLDLFASIPSDPLPAAAPLPRQFVTSPSGTPRAPDPRTSFPPSVNVPPTQAVPASALPSPSARSYPSQPPVPMSAPPMPRVAGVSVADDSHFAPQRPTVMLKPLLGRTETVLGWLLLLVVVAIVSAAIFSRWEWIRSAGGALLRNEPAPAVYVGTFRLRITSAPSHARVFENDQEIGATPFELVIHRGQVVQHPRQFVLRSPGYQAVAVVQSNTLQPETQVHVLLPALVPAAGRR